MARRKNNPTLTEMLAYAADDAVKALRAKRTEVEQETALLVKNIDAEIARVQEAAALLRGTSTTTVKATPRRKTHARRHTSTRRGRDAHQLAGPKNIKAAEKSLAKRGVATAAEVRHDTDKNSGTITYAMRALVEDGVARPTGRKVNRSPEFEYVPKSERVIARPGD